MSARVFRAACALGALCAPVALVLLGAAGIAAAAGRAMGRPVTDPLSIATLRMPVTTLTIEDAAGNAGPVFTDNGTNINLSLDNDLTVNGVLYVPNGSFLSGNLIRIVSGQTVFNFQDVDGNGMGSYTDAGTTSNWAFNGTLTATSTITGASYQATDANVVWYETGTNDFTIEADAAVTATLSATAANPTGLAGQIAVAHISGGGGSTTGAVAGTGCGTSSLPTQSGNDIGGTLGATCGTAGTTTNPFVTITFADAYSTAPFCTIVPANAATAAGAVIGQHVAVTTTTTLQVNCGGGTCTTGTLLWAYHCTQ